MHDANETAISLRHFARLRQELDEAIEDRGLLNDAPVERRQQARSELDRRISQLWHELRATRAEALHMPRDRILTAARQEAQLLGRHADRPGRSVAAG